MHLHMFTVSDKFAEILLSAEWQVKLPRYRSFQAFLTTCNICAIKSHVYYQLSLKLVITNAKVHHMIIFNLQIMGSNSSPCIIMIKLGKMQFQYIMGSVHILFGDSVGWTMLVM